MRLKKKWVNRLKKLLLGHCTTPNTQISLKQSEINQAY